MTLTKWTYGCLLAMLWSLSAKAQHADAVIDRSEILIGEQAIIRLSYDIVKGSQAQIAFPEINDTLVANVEVLKKSAIDTLQTGEGVKSTRLEQKLYITSFDSGFYAIPPFEFKVDNSSELTQAFLLTVNTVEIDTTGAIRGEKDIYSVDVSFMDYVHVYWPYGAAALGILLAAAIAFFLVKRYRSNRASKPQPSKEIPLKPAHLIALEKLLQIQSEKVYTRGNVKAYHTSITDVLREYMERTFDIPAPELTSKQIMDRLRYAGLDELHLTQLRTILFRADMVKFAKEYPDESENLSAINKAILFVEGTHPILGDSEIEETETVKSQIE